MAKVLGWIFVSIIIFGVLIGMTAALFGLEVATAGIVGRGKAHIEIQSAPSRIGGYNHFFDLCASVQNAESAIDQQTETLKRTSDPNEISRIQTNIDAQQITRSNGIHQYNADASKNYTIGQFRDSMLPYHLDDSPYEAGGEHTTCAY